jgi:hypothetical protein
MTPNRLVALLLVSALMLSSSVVHTRAQSSFTVIASTWGTAASPLEAEPGDKNMALTMTIQYTGSMAVSRLTVTLHPPSGFTDSNGATHPKAYSPAIQPSTIFQIGFSLDISSSVAIGSHTFSTQITWTTIDNSTNEEYVDVTVRLRGKVALTFQAEDTSLSPGQVNAITITVSNDGSGDASKILISITSPPQTSILTEMPNAFDLAAGQSRNLAISIFASAAAAGSAMTFATSAAYRDAYLNSRATTQNIGMRVSTIGQPSITVTASTDSLPSGETSQVDLAIQNKGTFSISSVSVTVTPQPPISLTDSDGRFSLGTLGAGSSKSLQASMFVAPSASSTASATVTLTYIDPSQTVRTEARTISFLLVPRTSLPLSVSLSTTSLMANSQSSIGVRITNNGGSTVTDVTATVTLTGPQTAIVGPSLFQISRIPTGGDSSFGLPVSTGNVAAASTATLTMAMSYLDSSSVQRSDSRSFGLTIEVTPTSSPLAIDLEPETLVAGTVNNLTVTLRNVGLTRLETLSASFSFPGSAATLLEPDIYQTPAIAPGNSAVVGVRAYVSSAAAASVVLQVSLKYYDEKQILTQETRSLGLLSRGVVDLKLVDYSVIPDTPYPGQIFSITATLTNMGTITASAVTATPNLTTAFTIFGARSVFVGDVLVDNPVTFTLSLQVSNETAPGQRDIMVELGFLDNLRSPLSVNEVVSVSVIEKPQPPSTGTSQSPLVAGLRQGGTLMLVGVVTLVLGLFLGRRMRRK